jgi:ligand-binding sensor domain-containing protein
MTAVFGGCVNPCLLIFKFEMMKKINNFLYPLFRVGIKTSIPFLYFFIFSIVAKAQVWTNYLPSDNVQSIAIDAQGNKWFGTNGGGVLKFDGTTWITYNTTNTNNRLASNDVRSIAIDANGNKWFGTNGGGVSKLEGSTWTNYTKSNTNNGLAFDGVRSIVIDAQGNKWVGTDGGGISKLEGSTWTNYTKSNTNNGLASNIVISIAIDAQGNKWVGTDGGGVSKLEGSTWTNYNTTNSELADDYVSSIAIDAQGNKWVGGNVGVSKLEGTTWTNYNTSNNKLASNNIKSITIDAQGNKWFGNNGGVSKLEGTTWTNYNTTNNELFSNGVRSIAIDAQGNKWFGTYGGVSKLGGTTWTNYNLGLVDANVRSVAIDAQGNKWFGTDDGVSKLDGTTWTKYTSTNTNNNGLLDKYVFSIAIDAQGNKWFGTNGGVSKLEGSTWTNYTTSNTENRLASNYVRSIAIDAQGNKWFGTYDGGVSKLEGTTWTNYNTTNSGLASNLVNSIAIDAQGNKWFGTNSGVSKLEGITWTNYYTSNNGLASNLVNSIAIDAQGNKWFGTYSGVSKLEGTTWTNYAKANNGLIHNYVRSIAIDAQGNKWFGTDNGVSKLEGTNWTNYPTTNTFNGFNSNTFQSIAIDVQGNKWFGTNSGVFKFGTAQSDIEGGLIAYYPLDGDAKDKSPNGLDGAPTTNITYTDGVKGKAAVFNGNSSILLSSVSGAYQKLSPSKITLSLWAKYGQNDIPTSAWTYLLRNRTYGYQIIIDKNGLGGGVYTNTSTGLGLGTPTHKFDVWRHVVITYDGTKMIYYVDGVETGRLPAIGDIYYTLNDAVSLGQDGTAGSFFKGLIDEVRIYDRAITEDEVKLLYGQSVQPDDINRGLIAHYPFNGDTKDIGPNGLHGLGTVPYEDFGNGSLGAKFNGNVAPNVTVTDGRKFATKTFTVSASIKETAQPITSAFGNYFITKKGYTLFSKYSRIANSQTQYTMNALINSKIYENKYALNQAVNGNSFPSTNHVVLTCDGSIMKLYCNGKVVKTDMTPNEAFEYSNTDNILTLAVKMGGFTGMLQNVRFYDRVINDNEVNILFKKDSEKKTIDKIDIIPASSGRAGRLIAYVRGKGFTDRSEVTLLRIDADPIKGKILKTTDNLLTVEFNFTESEKTGKYDIEVRNFVNATVYTQPKAFELKSAKKSKITVDIGGYHYESNGRYGWEKIEVPTKLITKGINNPGHFDLKILADGNTPIEDVDITVVIQQLERNVPLQIENTDFDYNLSSVEKIIFNQPKLNPKFIEGKDDRGLINYTWAFKQKVVYPGLNGNLKFEVVNKIQDNSAGKFVIAVQKAAKFNNPSKPEFGCSDCANCGLDLLGFAPGVGCLAGLASASCTFMNDESRVIDKTVSVVGGGVACVPIVGKVIGEFAKKIVDKTLGIFSVDATHNDCEACGVFTNEGPHEVIVTSSFVGLKNSDDNQISLRNSIEGGKIKGPIGFTSDRYIGNGTNLKYGIEYENLLRDTVGSMVFKQQLDTSVFDLSTFGFSNYGMGDTIFQHFNGDDDFIAFDHDLRPRKNTILRHIASIDRVKGIVEWYFNSLDPNTYEPIAHKKQGFLPPNDSTGKGLGFVEYYIESKSDLAHKTKIKSTADIKIDTSTTITTPSWINTIDDKKPTSTLKGRSLNDTTFQVIFSGSDLGSGVRFYDLYVSENKPTYRLLASNLKRDTINVIVKKGVKYNFFSQARDNVGNWEDTTHTAKVSPIKENIKEQDKFKLYPNPSTGIINVVSPWEDVPIQIYVTDWAGRIIYQQKFVNKDVIEVQLKNFPFGIYFISLKNERTGETKVAKLVHE